MNRKSGSSVSRGKRVGKHLFPVRLFSHGVTAVMTFALAVVASVPIVGACRSADPHKLNHTLSQIRLHGSHHLTSQSIIPQFQQSGSSTQSSAPAATGGAGASQGIPSQNPNTQSSMPPRTPRVGPSGPLQGGQVGGPPSQRPTQSTGGV